MKLGNGRTINLMNRNTAGSRAALSVSRLSEAQAGHAVAVLCDASIKR